MASKRRLQMTPSRVDQDPDYEVVNTPTAAKRQRVQEEDVKDQTVRRMQVVIKKQFNIALLDKEKEIELVDERLQKARIQLDKLRACIVARYYGKAGFPNTSGEKSKQKLDLSHPAIQRALGQPSQSHSPPPTLHIGEGDISLSRPSSRGDVDGKEDGVPPLMLESGRSTPLGEILGNSEAFLESERSSPLPSVKGPRNTGEDTFGVGPPLNNLKPPVNQADASEGSRFHVKKRIIVGNVSKYLPPGHREDSDPSTHKWMVYVRGPPEEPRIDHFVEKVWFFLHPSYRPNDLLEVKEPPFHLTRRGWGEFPIRVQLHFKDPRNKKVDIIHHLKLDRTYTGLQTLGAETIVDVELDRYLFNESGDPLSRPSTPTVTKVNYKEGLKPDLSRVPTPIRSHVTLANDDARRQNLTSPSPLLLESIARTPESTPDRSRPPSRSSTLSSPLVKPLPGEGSNRATPISIDTNYDRPREENSDIVSSSVLSLGKLSSKVKAQSGPALLHTTKPPRTMPPLGPISTNINKASLVDSVKPNQVSPTSIESIFSSSLVTSNGGAASINSQAVKDTQVSPTHTGAINVGDMAMSSPGSKLRIQDGVIVPDGPARALSPPQVKTENKTVVTLNQLGSKPNGKVMAMAKPTASSTPAVSLQRIPIPSLTGRPQTLVTASSPQVQTTVGVPQLTKQPLVAATTMVRKTASGVTLVQPSQAAKQPQVVQPQPAVVPVASNSPAGTQYYVTAKSTDKNLQGKVILIPQQVFSGDQTGKVGQRTTQGQASKQGSGSFLSPSNVLILPQGSIVPPLPPGSIVQIQPVPTPSRPSPQQANNNPTQQMTRIALTQKSGASTIISPKPATQRVASAGGVIQIQRSAGQTLAKLVPAGTPAVSQQASSSVSLIPEMKGQLARTPAGGVVLVQRTGATSKAGAVQAVPAIQNVVTNQIAPVAQKVTLNPIAMTGGLSQQKGALPIKGGASVLLSQASKAVSSKTVILQSPALQNSTKTIQVRTGQPTVKTITKFVPPLDDIYGQISKTTDKANTNNSSAIGSVIDDGGKNEGSTSVLNASISDGNKSVSTDSVCVTKLDVLDTAKGLDIISRTAEATSRQSAISPGAGGDVQSLESMQVNVSETCADVEVTESNKHPVRSEGNGINDDTNGNNVENNCSVLIKEEPNIDVEVEEGMEVGMTLNPTEAGFNGHCEEASLLKQDSCINRTSVVGDSVKKTNGTIVCDKLSVATTKATNTANIPGKCMIKVVNAKPQKSTSGFGIDASKVANKVRVIRIKQEPGTDPILATLATAPITTLDEGKGAPKVPEEEDEGELQNWESRDLRMWKRILEEQFVEGTSLYGVTSIEQLVKYVAEEAPLIDPTRVQNELPFCATSLEHYHSWTIAKRRSMEWQRAVFMRDKVMRLKARVQCLRKVPMWTKKKIMIWCRRHGFTPPEPDPTSLHPWSRCKLCGEMDCQGRQQNGEKNSRTIGCLKNHLSKAGVLKNTTFSVPDELGQRLKNCQSLRRGMSNNDDVVIDVITVGDPSKRLKVKTESEEQVELKCFMPPSEGALCVREAAEKIGVHFRPIQVGEDTYSPVIQEMIYAATRQFLRDLLKESLAKSYGNRQDHRLPDEVLPLHVHQAVASMQSCDFLTNNHIGVIASSTESMK